VFEHEQARVAAFLLGDRCLRHLGQPLQLEGHCPSSYAEGLSVEGGGMKFYIYVSDAKLDMLFAQMPMPISKRIAADLSIDLKVVSVSLTHTPSDASRYSKLKVVTKYIEENEKVGSVGSPRAYFKGVLPMRWGPYGGNYGRDLSGKMVSSEPTKAKRCSALRGQCGMCWGAKGVLPRTPIQPLR
jgi:hypothetical protein